MKNIRFRFLLAASSILLAGKISLTAATETNSWLLTSPDGQCAITVSLGDDGNLSYQVSRAGKIVIQKSPLGLRRDDHKIPPREGFILLLAK